MEKKPRRSIGKVDRLPPEHKAAVEQMLLSNQMTYKEIVEYLKEQGHEMSQMAICNYARKYLANVQMLNIAQENFRMMVDELDKYPDLDVTSAIAVLAGQNIFNAMASIPEEKHQEMDPEDIYRQANGLIRAVAYKKRVDVQNQKDFEAGFDAAKELAFGALAKERPDLYGQVADFLNQKKKESGS